MRGLLLTRSDFFSDTFLLNCDNVTCRDLPQFSIVLLQSTPQPEALSTSGVLGQLPCFLREETMHSKLSHFGVGLHLMEHPHHAS